MWETTAEPRERHARRQAERAKIDQQQAGRYRRRAERVGDRRGERDRTVLSHEHGHAGVHAETEAHQEDRRGTATRRARRGRRPDLSSEGVENSIQFTGRENDGATGLHYYRARYYHPGLHRFISEDPVGFDWNEPNLYVYASNNPVNRIDPAGLRTDVVITYDPVPFTFGLLEYGSHAALRIDNGGKPILYDSGGGYNQGSGSRRLRARP